ncbi:MAG: heptaprenylglyceryl phosphate synthase [Thermoleophilia bacterium]|nr:heptaprenylglyceryl phosphate synthase [Thermoleophilia bacterium]
MTADYREWRRIVKLDPARALSGERLEEICAWDVDALVIGGTGGYGLGEVLALLGRLRGRSLPLALEVSDPRAVCPGFDLYLIPMVLNSTEVDWVVGHHQATIKRYGDIMDWERLVVEGYCILNAGATAARLSQARTDLALDDVVAFARLAEHLLKLPIFYVEYSGTYGSPEVVAAVREVLRNTRLWYGGGIQTPEQAEEMASVADAIVVGNALYEGQAPLAARR